MIQCKTQFEKRQMLNVLVPQLNGKQGSTEICDLLEWSAAAALNIQWLRNNCIILHFVIGYFI